MVGAVREELSRLESKGEDVASTLGGGAAAPPPTTQFTCGDCGNRDQRLYVHDTKSGDTICTRCGVVVQDHHVIEGAANRNFEGQTDRNTHGPSFDKRFAGSTNFETTFDGGTNSTVLKQTASYVNDNISNVGLKERRTRQSYKDRHKRKVFQLMDQVGAQTQIHDMILERAKDIFTDFRQAKEQVQNPREVMTACMFIALDEAMQRNQHFLRSAGGDAVPEFLPDGRRVSSLPPEEQEAFARQYKERASAKRTVGVNIVEPSTAELRAHLVKPAVPAREWTLDHVREWLGHFADVCAEVATPPNPTLREHVEPLHEAIQALVRADASDANTRRNRGLRTKSVSFFTSGRTKSVQQRPSASAVASASTSASASAAASAGASSTPPARPIVQLLITANQWKRAYPAHPGIAVMFCKGLSDRLAHEARVRRQSEKKEIEEQRLHAEQGRMATFEAIKDDAAAPLLLNSIEFKSRPAPNSLSGTAADTNSAAAGAATSATAAMVAVAAAAAANGDGGLQADSTESAGGRAGGDDWEEGGEDAGAVAGAPPAKRQRQVSNDSVAQSEGAEGDGGGDLSGPIDAGGLQFQVVFH